MFGRRDTPPAGVQKRQHFLIGIAPHSYLCTVAMRSSRGPVPMIYVYPKELKQLDQLTICLGGLPGGVDVQVEISSPSGRVRRRVFKTTDGGTARWDLQILPPGPPGAYTVSVAQGKLRLGETVKVKKATKPRMVVVPRKARSGGVFVVALAGFPPHRPVALRLYRRLSKPGKNDDKGPLYEYAGTVKVRTDKNGIATYRLKSSPGDRTGVYLVTTHPESHYWTIELATP